MGRNRITGIGETEKGKFAFIILTPSGKRKIHNSRYKNKTAIIKRLRSIAKKQIKK